MVRVTNSFSLNYLLKSSLHPVTPVFMGSWSTRSATKWRGVSAELTYNSYLRNGWVVIDTGVKGSSGTPIIEFSSWEDDVSDYNITLPNTLSYKFSFRNSSWHVGFLARTSIIAQEEWCSYLPSYYNVLNNSDSSRFLRKPYVFIAQLRPISFIFNRLVGLLPLTTTLKLTNFSGLFSFYCEDVRLYNNFFLFSNSRRKLNYFNRTHVYRREFLKFFIRDRILLYGRSVTPRVSAVTNFLEQFFYKRLIESNTRTHLSVTSTFGVSSALNTISTFEGIVFKLNCLVLFFFESRAFLTHRGFFNVILRSVIVEISNLSALNNNFVNAMGVKSSSIDSVINVINKKIIFFFKSVSLPFNLVSQFFFNFFIKNLITGVSRLLDFGMAKNFEKLPVSSNVLYSYKFKKLFNAGIWLNNSSGSTFLGGSTLPLDRFLREYVKARKRLFLPKKRFYRFKRKTNYLTKFRVREELLDVNGKRHPNIFRFRKKLFSRFKLLVARKQFLFLFFWSFNFFNFFLVKRPTSGFFWISTRLTYFFKSFSNFLKFYKFTFSYLKINFANSKIGNASTFAGNIKIYYWILYSKLRHLLLTFYSFSTKMFLKYWASLPINAFGFYNMAPHRENVLRHLKAFFLDVKESKLLPLFVERKAYTVGTLVLLFANVYGSFLSNSSRNVLNVNGILRNYLRFLVSLRRRIMLVFKRRFYGLLVNRSIACDSRSVSLASCSVSRSDYSAMPRNQSLSLLLSLVIKFKSAKLLFSSRRLLKAAAIKLRSQFLHFIREKILRSGKNFLSEYWVRLKFCRALVRILFTNSNVTGSTISKRERRVINVFTAYLTNLTSELSSANDPKFDLILVEFLKSIRRIFKLVRVRHNKLSKLLSESATNSFAVSRYAYKLSRMKSSLIAGRLAPTSSTFSRYSVGINQNAIRARFWRAMLRAQILNNKLSTLILAKRGFFFKKHKLRLAALKLNKYNFKNQQFSTTSKIIPTALSLVNDYNSVWVYVSALFDYGMYATIPNVTGSQQVFNRIGNTSTGVIRHIVRSNLLGKLYNVGSVPLTADVIRDSYSKISLACQPISEISLHRQRLLRNLKNLIRLDTSYVLNSALRYSNFFCRHVLEAADKFFLTRSRATLFASAKSSLLNDYGIWLLSTSLREYFRFKTYKFLNNCFKKATSSLDSSVIRTFEDMFFSYRAIVISGGVKIGSVELNNELPSINSTMMLPSNKKIFKNTHGSSAFVSNADILSSFWNHYFFLKKSSIILDVSIDAPVFNKIYFEILPVISLANNALLVPVQNLTYWYTSITRRVFSLFSTFLSIKRSQESVVNNFVFISLLRVYLHFFAKRLFNVSAGLNQFGLTASPYIAGVTNFTSSKARPLVTAISAFNFTVRLRQLNFLRNLNLTSSMKRNNFNAELPKSLSFFSSSVILTPHNRTILGIISQPSSFFFRKLVAGLFFSKYLHWVWQWFKLGQLRRTNVNQFNRKIQPTRHAFTNRFKADAMRRPLSQVRAIFQLNVARPRYVKRTFLKNRVAFFARILGSHANYLFAGPNFFGAAMTPVFSSLSKLRKLRRILSKPVTTTAVHTESVVTGSLVHTLNVSLNSKYFYCHTLLQRALVTRLNTLHTVNGVGSFLFRARSAFFRKVRAVKKLFLIANARKQGLMPRRDKKLNKLYWRLVNSGKLKVESWTPAKMPSMFSRKNEKSMQLVYETAKNKFRFTKIRSVGVTRKKIKAFARVNAYQLVLALKAFRFKFLRRFYRIFKKKRAFRRRILRRKLKRRILKVATRATLYLHSLKNFKLDLNYNTLAAKFVNAISKENLNFLTHEPEFLYKLLIRRVIAAVYSKTLMLKDCARIKFFKESKLAFVLNFVNFFFKKSSVFSSNLTQLAGVLSFSADGLSLFFDKWSHLLLRTSVLNFVATRETTYLHKSTLMHTSHSVSAPNFFTQPYALFLSASLLTSPFLRISEVSDFKIFKLFENTSSFFIWKRRVNRGNPWRFVVLRVAQSARLNKTRKMSYIRSTLAVKSAKRMRSIFLLKSIVAARSRNHSYTWRSSLSLKPTNLRKFKSFNLVKYARLLTTASRLMMLQKTQKRALYRLGSNLFKKTSYRGRTIARSFDVYASRKKSYLAFKFGANLRDKFRSKRKRLKPAAKVGLLRAYSASYFNFSARN